MYGMSFAPAACSQVLGEGAPSAVTCSSLNTMQPLDRQFLPMKNRHTSPATSGELDPLLQFEPEDPGVGRREHAAMSVRPSSISPSMRGEPAARRQRKIELPPVPRSKARRPLWTVVVSATCGSVLVAVILMQLTAPSPMASPKPVVPPPPAPPTVQTAAPVERSTDTGRSLATTKTGRPCKGRTSIARNRCTCPALVHGKPSGCGYQVLWIPGDRLHPGGRACIHQQRAGGCHAPRAGRNPRRLARRPPRSRRTRAIVLDDSCCRGSAGLFQCDAVSNSIARSRAALRVVPRR